MLKHAASTKTGTGYLASTPAMEYNPPWVFLAAREVVLAGWNSKRFERNKVNKKESPDPDSAYTYVQSVFTEYGYDLTSYKGDLRPPTVPVLSTPSHEPGCFRLQNSD